MTDVVVAITSVTGGAFVGFFANYFIERFKRRNAMNDDSRKAYASWFTAEALLLRRINTVCDRLVGFPTNRERHEALMVEIRSLADEGKELITSMNEAFLTEKNRDVRDSLSVVNRVFVRIVGTLEFSEQHYKENLAFHEHFERITADELATLPDRERDEWIETKEQFEKHDATCPFKLNEFRLELDEQLALTHKLVEKLRDKLAGTLSR
jgi:hypothetical protein